LEPLKFPIAVGPGLVALPVEVCQFPGTDFDLEFFFVNFSPENFSQRGPLSRDVPDFGDNLSDVIYQNDVNSVSIVMVKYGVV
jgi:hypothetical protein